MIVYVVDTETTGLGMTASGRVKITVTKQHKDSGGTDRRPSPGTVFFRAPNRTKSLSRSRLAVSVSSRKKTRTENKLIHVNYLVYM